MIHSNIKYQNIMLVVIAAFLFFLDLPRVWASVTVQPDSTEVVVNAGEDLKGRFTVYNDGSEVAHVKVESEDWPKKVAADVTVNQWLSVDTSTFDLKPKESREVAYTINVPSANNNAGEVSAMVYFGSAAPQGDINVTIRYGVSIYAAIADNINLGCKIGDVYVADNSVDVGGTKQFKGIIFTIDVINKGNVHLRPTGNISVTGPDGTKFDIPILRDFPTYVANHALQHVFWNKEDIAPGKYTAVITLDYGKLYNIDGKTQRKVDFTVNNEGSISF